jgi:hypothetical protein
MSSVDQGDTVEYVHEQLAALIAKGRGRERLWVDVVGRDEPASLYAGEDESTDTLGNIGVN